MFCLLLDCVLLFDGWCPAFYWIGRQAGYISKVAGKRQERIYFGLDEMCSAFYWDCILPFDRLCSAFYWNVTCLLIEWDGGRISLQRGRKGIHRRQERDTSKAGKNPGWSDEMTCFYGIVSCLLLECILPFDGMGWRQDISPTWQEKPIARRAGGVPACRPAVLYIPLGVVGTGGAGGGLRPPL